MARMLALLLLTAGSIALPAGAAPIVTQAEVLVNAGVSYSEFLGGSDMRDCHLSSPAPAANLQCSEQLSQVGAFSASAIATASLSSLGPDLSFSFTASVIADSSAVFPFQAAAGSKATLVIEFVLDQPMTWEISASSYSYVDLGPSTIRFITLKRVDDDTFPVDFHPVCCSGSFDGTGPLPPGSYRMLGHLNALSGERGDWAFQFRLVPEPSPLVLLVATAMPIGLILRRLPAQGQQPRHPSAPIG